VGAPGSDRYCNLPVVRPADQVCPYLSELQNGYGFVPDQVQQEALKDPRCLGPNVTNPVLAPPIVAEASALGALTGADATDLAQAAAELAAGGVVVGDPSFVHDGKVTIQEIAFSFSDNNQDPYTASPRIELPAYVLHSGTLTDAVLSPATVASLHFTQLGKTVVASTTRVPTVAERERAIAALAKLDAYPQIQDSFAGPVDPVLWVLMAAAGLVTLAAAAIGTGLAAADGRADLSTLAAVGASPRMRRGLSVSQSGVIAGLGSILGAAAGIGACAAIITALNVRYLNIWPQGTAFPFRMPWLALLVALVIVPSIAILGAGLLTRSRLPIERRL
jgi:putative ABC transport system permease protein